MEIGQVQETVTVTAEPPLLQAATASRGGLIENLRITELPLQRAQSLHAGESHQRSAVRRHPQFTRPFDNGDNVNFSINGGLRQTNEYLLDGTPDNAVTDNNDLARTQGRNNIAYIPTGDATQEFKIIQPFYDS
jgi:hypothetical protein